MSSASDRSLAGSAESLRVPDHISAGGSATPIKIALLLLCHETPRVIARRLSGVFFSHPDIKVYIHYDARRDAKRREELRGLIPASVNWTYVANPVKCKWGEYSLVEATHKLMATALADADFQPDRLVLQSGSCIPFRPVGSLQTFLERHPATEFIQAQDIARKQWVTDGLEGERYRYYFPFNFISHRKWFEAATNWQRRLGVHRKAPEGLRIHFGSQWFCLTRATAAAVCKGLDDPSLRAFFRWSWIPDEFAIQTLVAAICPPSRVSGYTLTYYEFDQNGKPLILDNGHFEHLLKQPFFFARKIAPEALELMGRINDHNAKPEPDLQYFAHAGLATVDYQRHLVSAAMQKSLRARVGSTKDMWRGPMDSNRRYYYVLYASSREWLLHLIRTARGHAGLGLPLFDLPFDENSFEVAGGRVSYLGFKPIDRYRRDHDPAAYMHELVNAHPDQPAAFGLDLKVPGWARDFARWDSAATFVDCDPVLSREQKAATSLRELTNARDAVVVKQTLQAMATGGPLPSDFAEQIRASGEHTCQFVPLRDLGADLGDATLLALRDALHKIQAPDFYVPPDAAWKQFWR